MKVSEIMTRNVVSLLLDDTIGKALNIMYNERINQVPVTDIHRNFQGMVYAKQFLSVNLSMSSKLKSYLRNTSVLNGEDSLKKGTHMIVITGNRALPVVDDSKLIGILSETDVILKTSFDKTTVDNAMSNVIVINDDVPLSLALAKMRRHNVSRLPVINSEGILVGILNALEKTRLLATPEKRIPKDSWISTKIPAVSQIKAREVMRGMKFVKKGTKLNEIKSSFNKFEEIIIVDDKRKPIGILTPRDALEMILPRRGNAPINIINVSDLSVRRIIEANLVRFWNRMHGRAKEIKALDVYVDKYKTRKYSLRARLISSKSVFSAKAVAYEPSSASKKLISILDRQIRSSKAKKIRKKQITKSMRHAMV
ncbi:MAG TPA: CBS domain-containing protein [Nitrososphaeraceae archaeon]|jgi:CBS domain-containing protein